MENPANASFRCPIPSRSHPHGEWRHCCADLFSMYAVAPAIGPSAPSSRIPSSGFAQQIGDGRALCAISGGVDSTVAGTLVSRAIGDRSGGVFVNTGLLRKNEFEKVLSMLRDNLHLNVRGVDASERFLNMLSGVTDPEKKRKLIGNEFIRCLRRGSPEHRFSRFSGAGNSLSGCDRVGFGKRPFADDQIPSQCWRAAGAHAIETGRTLARTVQRRSTARRDGAWTAGGHGLASAISRARSGGTDYGRNYDQKVSACSRRQTTS